MKYFMLGRCMIKIRVLVSLFVCDVENGFVCYEADLGWF